jgi:hypothetical protein
MDRTPAPQPFDPTEFASILEYAGMVADNQIPDEQAPILPGEYDVEGDVVKFTGGSLDRFTLAVVTRLRGRGEQAVMSFMDRFKALGDIKEAGLPEDLEGEKHHIHEALVMAAATTPMFRPFGSEWFQFDRELLFAEARRMRRDYAHDKTSTVPVLFWKPGST